MSTLRYLLLLAARQQSACWYLAAAAKSVRLKVFWADIVDITSIISSRSESVYITGQFIGQTKSEIDQSASIKNAAG